MKIKCPECGSDSKKKYTQTELEDHIKEDHILESIAVNYVDKIFKIHEKIEYLRKHREGNPSYKTEDTNEIELLKSLL
jgi:hypothetical protein